MISFILLVIFVVWYMENSKLQKRIMRENWGLCVFKSACKPNMYKEFDTKYGRVVLTRLFEDLCSGDINVSFRWEETGEIIVFHTWKEMYCSVTSTLTDDMVESMIFDYFYQVHKARK